MLLKLIRKYYPNGTNGEISLEGNLICYCIELPWLQNARGISCIPEGKYEVKKRFSQKFNWHLHVTSVRGRSFILLHPANDAMKELNGCIAPVSTLTGKGKGNLSRVANEKIQSIVFPKLEKQIPVFLEITSQKI